MRGTVCPFLTSSYVAQLAFSYLTRWDTLAHFLVLYGTFILFCFPADMTLPLSSESHSHISFPSCLMTLRPFIECVWSGQCLLWKRICARAHSCVQKPAAWTNKCQCAEYQSCIGFIPPQASFIHHQTLPVLWSHLTLSCTFFIPSFFIAAFLSVSSFCPFVFLYFLFWVKVWWENISACPQQWVPVGHTCNHQLRLSTGCGTSSPFLSWCRTSGISHIVCSMSTSRLFPHLVIALGSFLI